MHKHRSCYHVLEPSAWPGMDVMCPKCNHHWRKRPASSIYTAQIIKDDRHNELDDLEELFQEESD